MKCYPIIRTFATRLLGIAMAASLMLPLPAVAATVALATAPLANSTTSSVSPNLMFMLDDSGSMDWDYMPDPTKNFAGKYGYNSPQCNGVYYNPSITYLPPLTSSGSSYPDSNFAAAERDGYNPGSTDNLNTDFTGGSGSGSSGINLTPGPAFYYEYNSNGTQTTEAQRDYYTTGSIFYKECNSAIGTTTAHDGTHPVNTVFTKRTLSTSETTTITALGIGSSTITITGSDSSQNVQGIKVNGTIEIMSGSTSNSGTRSVVAQRIRDKINDCTLTKVGSCDVSGYRATCIDSTCSNDQVTIIGPAAAGATLTISENDNMSFSATPFSASPSTSVSSVTVGGVTIGTAAASTDPNTLADSLAASINTATGYTATASGNVITVTGPATAANYTPVITTVPASGGITFTAGTFPETAPAKLTNFANWYSYYSNRMLMMKTGVGRAFAEITDKYRVGFMTMNNNVNPDIVDLAPFAGGCTVGSGLCQKDKWYTKLYQANPGNSTPLREALAKVGRLYAAKFSGSTVYTATITVSGSSSGSGTNASVSSVTVNGVELLAAATSNSTSNSTVASRISGSINTLALYDATASGSVVTITGPATAAGFTPVIEFSGNKTLAATSFSAHTTGPSLNGITPADPIQYSCQQNFIILSTDGFWNGNAGYKLDGSTAVGNQDGLSPRPYYDGAQISKTTSQLRMSQTQVTRTTSQTQKQTLQIQSRTSNLQKTVTQQQKREILLQTRTGQLQRSTDGGTNWSNVASCTWASPSVSSRTITIAGSSCTRVTSITIGNKELMSGRTSNNSGCDTPSTVASRTVSKINDCTSSMTGNCNTTGGHGYTASSSGSVVTISGATTDATMTVTNNGGGMTFTTATNYSSLGTSCRYDTVTAWTDATATCTAKNEGANTANGDTWNGNKVECRYNPATLSAATAVDVTVSGSCTPVTPSGSSPYTALVGRDCPTSTTTTNVSTCTPIPLTNGATTTCGYTAYSAYANATSCTLVSQDLVLDPGYDMSASSGVATDCRTNDSGWLGASSCTPGTSGGLTTNCQTATAGPTPVASCTDATANAGNSWTATSCTTTTIMPPTLVGSCTTAAASSSNGYVTTSCSPTSSSATAPSCSPQTATAGNNWTTITCSSSAGTSDTLADVAMYYYQSDLRDSTLSNCTGGTSVDFPGGNPDVCTDNVFVSGDDNNVKQHMTTFTLGLGARGRMVFEPNYLNLTSGDFYSVKTGELASAGPPRICSWQSNGACNWPVPGSGNPENIDDLWHAAVNGRGTYFSATDPASLSAGLSTALSSITARKGSAAAAATSTLNPVPGNNLAYLASYTTVKWTGNLEARSINVDTGEISTTATWCVENTTGGTCSSPGVVVTDTSGGSIAYYCVTPDTTGTYCGGTWDSTLLQCSVPMPTSCEGTLPLMIGPSTNSSDPCYNNSACDKRTILTADSTTSAAPALVDFVYANLNPAYFNSSTDTPAGPIDALTQWSALTSTQQTAAKGANLVNFLRGQHLYEEKRTTNPAANWIYRLREGVLGDVLESQPFFSANPVFSYTDKGYGGYKSANATLRGTVFVGANDGMMHAFAAKDDSSLSPPDVGGKERWAFVPSMVIPNMWKLADKSYDIKHTNYINGSVNVADICTANCLDADAGAAVWKTILVGGLNAGGRGYYALDVTDPTSPVLLWEFTSNKTTAVSGLYYGDANLGYSYGNPVITKIADGTWVVMVTSGYNNVSPGDGKGYLYVLNAATGAIIKTISTGVGDTTTPSGLSRIATWNDSVTSNEAGFTYGGDLLGNVWRFDINAAVAAGVNPLKFATLFSDSGGTVPQPVTTAPVLGSVNGKRVIFIGTGKYLEPSDLGTAEVQNEYAIMDDDETTTLVNPRNTLVEQTLTLATTTTRTGSSNAVEIAPGKDRGWFVDFPTPGERMNIDGALISGTLLVPTIVPSTTICSPGGYGWFNYFDFKTGGLVSDSDRFNSGIVGFNVIYLHGKPILKVVLSSGEFVDPPDQPIPPVSATGFNATRALWRELLQ